MCASGSWWVSHKFNAMKSKFGAYTNHLTALSMDNSVKAVVAKLQGYLRKWVVEKYLLDRAFFTDLSLPCVQYNLDAFTSLCLYS